MKLVLFCKYLIISLLYFILFTFNSSFAQNQLTFYQDIQPIIHKNCTPCHQPNQIGPFNLITYQDVASRAHLIVSVTESRFMPPWHADPDFRSFANERRLTEEEINKISAWVKGGLKEGKKIKSKENINLIQTKQGPDLVLTMNKPFAIPGNNSEQFIFFNLPTNLPEDKYIKAIEFVAGNKKQVHHSRIMSDTSNKIRGIDGMSEADPKVLEFQKIPLYDQFIYGWVPGNLPIFYPEGMGKKIKKNTDIILNVHYAPSPIATSDQSSIKFYFAKEPINREVITLTLNESYISNQPFYIKAQSKPTFYMSSGLLPEDISLLAILPHMHRIGKTFRVTAITPSGEVINLIKIDEWDFNWQTTYQFKSMIHLPKESIILAEATYDNTDKNPANPFNPPKDIGYGWNTTDEMMNLIIYYVKYQSGDEKIDLYKK